MLKALCICAILILFSQYIYSNSIKGKIVDENNEPLIGSVVSIPELKKHFVAGFDGTLIIDNIPEGEYEAIITCIGFKEKHIQLKFTYNTPNLTIKLEENINYLNDFSVVANKIQNTERSARLTEKATLLSMNVMSAQAIQLSTDLDVGGVVQRISGISLESSGSGTGSYSIIRGMPKRYNATLVNGLKIPSPDNKHRYVPMDIFPSGLIERVEVYKSLTPSREADAIGGVVNLIMKDAPMEPIFRVDISYGQHTLFSEYDFNSFDRSVIKNKSPFELYGPRYFATQDDFTKKNLELINKSFVPDFNANLVTGRRFVNGRLGTLIAISGMKEHKGSKQTRMLPEANRLGSGAPQLNNMQERFYSNELTRIGTNLKLDYIISPNHIIKWSNLFVLMDNQQVRDGIKTRIWGVDDPSNSNVKTFSTRFLTDQQQMLNSSFSGNHNFGVKHELDWALAYSFARKDLPDQGKFVRVLNNSKGPTTSLIAEDGDNERRWEYNTDNDITTSVNYSFRHKNNHINLKHKVGGLARLKTRNSFYVNYKMEPDPGVQAFGYDWKASDANLKYTTWEKYEDVTWKLNSGTGSTTNALNYDATENYLAAYYEFEAKLNQTTLLGGFRAEQVNMGYTLLAPRRGEEPKGEQSYFDLLPSFTAKHDFNNKTNIKASFFKASTKPGFFELVPFYQEDEDEPDYRAIGNPHLKKVISYNYDIKVDYFPKEMDKISAGIFYKRIVDPIESVLYADSSRARTEIVRGNLNMGTAVNYGAEFELIKYVRNLGVRLNYTYTESSITTNKLSRQRKDPNDPSSDLIPVQVKQKRPLQGQAQHIGNFSLLYKDFKRGWDAQLALVYTGARIKLVSGFYNMDEWEKPYQRLDFSIDKKLGKFTVFGRAKNILNTPYRVFIKYPVQAGQENLPLQTSVGDNYVIREDLYGMSIRLGFKYKL